MKARLGQNFLAGAAWQNRVVAAVSPRGDDLLLEIGGGPGEITARLADLAGFLRVVEVDPALAAGLRRRFAGRNNVEVVEADILAADLRCLASPPASAAPLRPGLRVFGNLPYYITSPILLHLFAAADLIRDAIVMVQREVAERILARPGSADFGLLSATVQFHAQARLLFHLPPSAFRPPPQVESSLLALTFACRAGELGVETEAFSKFLRLCFQQKRKQLVNNLKSAYAPAAIAAALQAADVDARVRAEALGLEKLAAIHRALICR